MKKFNEIREENERLAAKNATKSAATDDAEKKETTK